MRQRGRPFGDEDQIGGWTGEPTRSVPYGTKSAAEVKVVDRHLTQGAAADV